MKNVTITLAEEVAHWVRIRAAKENQSVSRFFGDILRQQMMEKKGYEEAMDRSSLGSPCKSAIQVPIPAARVSMTALVFVDTSVLPLLLRKALGGA